jgi:hypothetical protein
LNQLTEYCDRLMAVPGERRSKRKAAACESSLSGEGPKMKVAIVGTRASTGAARLEDEAKQLCVEVQKRDGRRAH